MRAPTTLSADDEGTDLVLVVMGPEVYAVRTLPSNESMTVGRAPNADLPINDPLASRLHVRVTVSKGDKVEVEDLGSRNGTRIRGDRIPTGSRVPVAAGDTISIGATTLLIKRRSAAERSRDDWGHAYFLGRIEEECRRHLKSPRSFSVVRLRLDADSAPRQSTQLVAEAISPSDVLASFAPNEHELLLLDRGAEQARRTVANVMSALSAAGARCTCGLASFPADGHNAEALLARAGDLLRGQAGDPPADAVVFTDPSVLAALAQAEKAASRDAAVLLLGETGVGKEEFARHIHAHSPRAGKPFVIVDCAWINPNLIESELFGHARGAFTGASTDKAGLLEQAPGGTVFLDEIGELPLAVQAKLLRVLETRQLTRLGAVDPRPLNVRFIAATNRNLAVEMAAKTFREDLYHRLAVFEIRIPALRDRRRDIVPLAQAFLRRFCREDHRPNLPALSSEALALLQTHAWPGNVRELRNAMERALAYCSGQEILPEHLSFPVPDGGADLPVSQPSLDLSRLDAAELGERQRMIEALEACTWNQTRAAKKLGMPQSTFSLKLGRYQIPRPRKRS
jgi:two-component system, NtrC family, response regulator AtoC